MKPWAKEGDFVLVDRMSYLFLKPKVGHVVVARHPQDSTLLLIKRIVKEENNLYWVEGDSSFNSTDSRDFGWLKREFLVGKVIHRTGSFALGIIS